MNELNNAALESQLKNSMIPATNKTTRQDKQHKKRNLNSRLTQFFSFLTKIINKVKESIKNLTKKSTCTSTQSKCDLSMIIPCSK